MRNLLKSIMYDARPTNTGANLPFLKVTLLRLHRDGSVTTLLRMATFVVLSSCLVPVPEQDGGASHTSGASDGGQRCVEYGEYGQVCASPAPGFCGGRVCGEGELCCVLTSSCFPRTRPELCAPLPGNAGGERSCGSTADCSPDEFCRPLFALRLCGGRGVCQSISNCGFCGGGPLCEVCGCNGVTYSTMQEACVAGVWARPGKCGTPGPRGTNCGASSQCSTGELCCSLTGKCYAESEPWRCEQTPDGSVLDCARSAECSSGAGGGASGSGGWCSSSSCGRPGRCMPRPSTAECPGTIERVCGCDGKTYINECWARAGGSGVASPGACPDSGM